MAEEAMSRGSCKKGDECRYSCDLTDEEPADRICKFFQKGKCAFGVRCWFLHTKPAETKRVATRQTLALPSTSLVDPSGGSLPGDDTQRSEPTCAEAQEQEISSATEGGVGLTCCVCLEAVLDKEEPEERRFGLLTDCSHCYCLTCIRKWRRTRQSGRRSKKACPVCQITSKFFIPSERWVDDEDEKKELIEGFMESMRGKPCRHFDEGRGRCRFGPECFYKHAFPDGRLEEAPPRRRRRRFGRRTRDSWDGPLWNLFVERGSPDFFDEADGEDSMRTPQEMNDLNSVIFQMFVANFENFETEFEDD